MICPVFIANIRHLYSSNIPQAQVVLQVSTSSRFARDAWDLVRI